MSARILIVDDILPNVKLLEAKLTNEYYDVITASSGAEALEKIENESPDIVLLDVMMPEMDGFECCRIIKGNPKTSHIPVVMVTALTDVSDRVNGLEAGADDFLTKPVNDIALFARVRSLVRLKMTVDEWRARENTATSFGVLDDNSIEIDDDEPANILIVEDQDFDADKFFETCTSEGHTATRAVGGFEAMEYVGQYQFDVIMVSLNMNEDGLRLISHLRSNDKTRSVPIVMIGASEDMPKIAQGLEIGAHDYVLRPVDKNELKARLKTQIRRKRFQEKLKENYEVSLSMALTDSLTGLYNRRYLNAHLEKLLQQDGEQRKPIALLMFDIDHFKSVNDTHGHAVGDEILIAFANRIKGRLRTFDILARTGGEEFVAVLVDVGLEKACYIAERLRRGIANDPMPASIENGELSITCSVGGAYIGQDVVDVDDAIERSDKLLYKAKENGRNKVVFEQKGALDPQEYQEAQRMKVGE
jgi:two-component system cell cycle response regulator